MNMPRKIAMGAALLGLFIPLLAAEEITVYPEVATPVIMSNTDVNRINCINGDISDVVFSGEKGVKVERPAGKNAFVKYTIKVVRGEHQYVKRDTEFHVVCDGAIYTLIATPREGEPVTVRLSDRTKTSIKANVERFAGMAREDAILKATLDIMRNENMGSYRVTKHDEEILLFKEVRIKKRQRVVIEGSGLVVHDYTVTLLVDVPNLTETAFVDAKLGQHMSGITLVPQGLKAGQTGRLIIVEEGNNHD